MTRGLLLITLAAVPCFSGCAAVVATTETVKIVGRTTREAVHVVTWPVREAIKLHNDSKKESAGPVTTVKHGDGDAAPARKRGGDDVQLASHSDEDDGPKSGRGKSRSDKSDGSKKAKSSDAESDSDAGAKSDDDLGDGNETKSASKSDGKSNWRNKRNSRGDDNDPDTIRIK